jgi:putative spermidine/putrescine transport system substrate-binding protein
MKISRKVWISALVVAVVLAAGAYFLLRKVPQLSVVTWSGPYGRAQASALFIPYQQRSGVDVHIGQYDGGLDELRHRVKSKSYGWDVIDFELPDAIAACREGLLEPIDPAGLTDTGDFVPHALGRCWVGSVVYSQAIAYAPQRFGAARPATLADFFDTAKFPGPRALHGASPKFNLELALLADGVAPGDIYKVLSTPQGVARAFTKLETLGPIMWWTQSSEPAQMLKDGRAAFATILNGDIYDAAAHKNPLGVIWDRQLYELDVFGIPKGDPKHDMAMDFIRFATAPESLARVADWVPYGPARRSAVALVTRNPELGTPMRPFLPTAPENFRNAFAVDDAWWQLHGAEAQLRWQGWQSLRNR